MAPKVAGKKGEKRAGKAKAPSDGKKKRRGKRKESYAIYIYKVLKQVHPDTGISSKAMGIMNSFVNDIFERIATEASRSEEQFKTRKNLRLTIKTLLFAWNRLTIWMQKGLNECLHRISIFSLTLIWFWCQPDLIPPSEIQRWSFSWKLSYIKIKSKQNKTILNDKNSLMKSLLAIFGTLIRTRAWNQKLGSINTRRTDRQTENLISELQRFTRFKFFNTVALKNYRKLITLNEEYINIMPHG